MAADWACPAYGPGVPGRPEARAIHRRGPRSGRCAADGQPWPCLPATVTAALDAIDGAGP